MNFKAWVRNVVVERRSDGDVDVKVLLVAERIDDSVALLIDSMLHDKPVVVSADG